MGLAIFQQLTGINVVMFYSGTIFRGDDSQSETAMSAVFVNFLVFGVNFFATAASVFLLGCFGRKSLMTVFSAA